MNQLYKDYTKTGEEYSGQEKEQVLLTNVYFTDELIVYIG